MTKVRVALKSPVEKVAPLTESSARRESCRLGVPTGASGLEYSHEATGAAVAGAEAAGVARTGLDEARRRRRMTVRRDSGRMGQGRRRLERPLSLIHI